MPIDATATATAATVAVSASASSMTMSHGSITKQTMVRILTLSSLLFKWDYGSQTTCAAKTSLIVATLRTQPTSKLFRCLVRTDRPVQCKLTCGCADRSGNMSILGSAAKRRHRAKTQTAAKNGSAVSQRVFPFVRVGFLLWFWSGFPFLFWTTLFASWGSVSFSSVPCLASTVPFPMTPPYVGGTSSFLNPSQYPLTLVATLLACPDRA